MAEKKPAPESCESAVPAFSKENLLTFRRYAKRRDLLSVLLEDGERYTTAQVDEMLETFMTRKKGRGN